MFQSNKLLPALGLAMSAAIVGAIPPPTTDLVSRDTSPSPVIIQMFQWNWDSVAKECTEFIGPAGYSYVQVSPATEHADGDAWYLDYQTVSYNLDSRRGNADQFANMVKTCNNAGVGVVLDTCWNHMAGTFEGHGVGGSSFKQYEYPGFYSAEHFHHCGTKGDGIENYHDKYQVQNCQLENLADLKTEDEYVRNMLKQHANDMLAMGVAGFRLDAAKHIPIEDLNAIFGGLSRKPFITSEVIGSGPPIPQTDYTGLGLVSASDYQDLLQKAFRDDGLISLQDIESKVGGLTSDQANVWVNNMDSERGHDGGGITYKEGKSYELAHVFALTHPYGTPTILSSFEFEDVNAGAPNRGTGTCDGNAGSNGWLCQHRWTSISNLVKFRTSSAGAPLTNWQSGSPQQIAYERAGKGFVVINNSDGDWTNSWTCGLPDGTYCDVIAGSKASSQCTGTSVKASGGMCSGTAPAHGALAVYIDSKL